MRSVAGPAARKLTYFGLLKIGPAFGALFQRYFNAV